MSEGKEFKVGDRVVCNVPGSWVDGKQGVIGMLNIQSSDGIDGHLLRIDGSDGYTVVPAHEMVAANDLKAIHGQAANLVERAAHLVREAAIKLSGTAWSGNLSHLTSEIHDTARRVRDYDPSSD